VGRPRIPLLALGSWFAALPGRDKIAVMQVSVLYFADCPNWREAGRRIRTALDHIGRAGVEVTFVPVETEIEAAQAGFGGSRTFTVDGVDLFGGPGAADGMSCRLYATDGGLAGVPEVADLVAALRERIGC